MENLEKNLKKRVATLFFTKSQTSMLTYFTHELLTFKNRNYYVEEINIFHFYLVFTITCSYKTYKVEVEPELTF